MKNFLVLWIGIHIKTLITMVMTAEMIKIASIWGSLIATIPIMAIIISKTEEIGM